MFCAATRGGGSGRGRGRGRVNPLIGREAADMDAAGRGRGRGDPSLGQDLAQANAAAARADAADAAQDAVKDAGDQLADAIGSGVNRAEGAAASTQSQGAVSPNARPFCPVHLCNLEAEAAVLMHFQEYCGLEPLLPVLCTRVVAAGGTDQIVLVACCRMLRRRRRRLPTRGCGGR